MRVRWRKHRDAFIDPARCEASRCTPGGHASTQRPPQSLRRLLQLPLQRLHLLSNVLQLLFSHQPCFRHLMRLAVRLPDCPADFHRHSLESASRHRVLLLTARAILYLSDAAVDTEWPYVLSPTPGVLQKEAGFA